MRFNIPPIYPITDTRISGLSVPEQVRRLVAGGATFIQIRDKDAASSEFLDSAVEAVGFAKPRGVRIIINDRVDIALLAKADGVHLGQTDLPVSEARQMLGDNAIIGISTHSIDQFESALEQPVDYIAIGPIFLTGTKNDPDPIVGLELLTKVKQIAGEMPVVAIGGIDRSNIHQVYKAGADCAAIISWILSAPDQISSRVTELVESAPKPSMLDIV